MFFIKWSDIILSIVRSLLETMDGHPQSPDLDPGDRSVEHSKESLRLSWGRRGTASVLKGSRHLIVCRRFYKHYEVESSLGGQNKSIFFRFAKFSKICLVTTRYSKNNYIARCNFLKKKLLKMLCIPGLPIIYVFKHSEGFYFKSPNFSLFMSTFHIYLANSYTNTGLKRSHAQPGGHPPD